MAEIDTSSWKEFRLDKLFEKIKTGKIQGKANDFPTQKDEEHTIPLLTAGAENQGLARYAVRNDCPTILKNVISISANGANTGITFYQDNEFAVLQDAYAIKLKNMEIPNEQVGLFLASCVNKILYGNFSWTYKAGWERVKGMSICLPVTSSGEIDWKYMQERIAELEQERIAELEQERIAELEHYLVASGLNDYELTEEDKSILATELFNGDDATELPSENGCRKEARKFRVGDLFEVKTPVKKFNASSVEITDKIGHPYVVRSSTNNGIRGYINEDEKYLNEGNTFSFGQDTATIFWQEKPFFTGDKIKILKPKFACNSEIANYIMNGIAMAFCYFSWGTQSFKVSVIEDAELLLPIQTDTANNPIINPENTYHPEGYIPDWSFMEKYIRAVEKVVIKDVVDWKDEEIKKTKEIVS